MIALGEASLQNRQRKRVLQQPLDCALEGTSTKRGIVSLGGENFPRLGRELKGQLAISKELLQTLQLQIDDVLNVLLTQRMEDDDVVDAIEELGTEMLP